MTMVTFVCYTTSSDDGFSIEEEINGLDKTAIFFSFAQSFRLKTSRMRDKLNRYTYVIFADLNILISISLNQSQYGIIIYPGRAHIMVK